MSRQRKYEKVGPILSMMSLVVEFNARNYIFYNHKLMHFGFWGSWPMRYLAAELRAGRLFYARKFNNEPVPF